MTVRLDSLSDCLQGVVPSIIATCSRDGEPNVTYLSHVYYIDEQHVGLSCQFFNKTKQNTVENPVASIVLYHPVTMAAWRILVEFLHVETEGPLFERMSARIEVIASHTGMAGVFKLRSADVYRVLAIEPVDGFLMAADTKLAAEAPAVAPTGPLTELRGLQKVSERIAGAKTLDELLTGALASLDEVFGFSHAKVFLRDADGDTLRLRVRSGYGPVEACAHPVAIGAGLVGTVAQRRRMIRIAGVGQELRYGAAVRRRFREHTGLQETSEPLPEPGLVGAQVQIGLPLLVGDALLGVLAMESVDPLCFDEWDEVFLQILANQIAMGIDRTRATPRLPAGSEASASVESRRFTYYAHDDCVFVDGEYLVRNLPGRILWKLLCAWRDTGRTTFTNRELRLDRTLGLPPIKDNLESRLILLRKRLSTRDVGLRLVPISRGRFALEVDGAPTICDEQPA